MIADPALQLAHRGRSLVTVVLPDSAGKQTRLAADDLTRCLYKALGARVSIVAQLSMVKTPVSILIGDDCGVDFTVSADGLQRDGCVIKTHGTSVLISGPTDYGIANGIYTFLMDYIGVRWFAPGDLYEVVPRNHDLALPQIDLRKNPDFSYRIFSGVNGDAGAAWQRRNRIDTDRSGLPYFGFGHNLANIFPVDRYGKDHPEYYAMIGGQRQVDGGGVAGGAQPCFTNPDVIRIAAEAADDYFKKNPQATTFSLCINDNARFCQCPDCAALDQPTRKSNGGWDTYSDSYFHFVREVAGIVKKTNPGRYLGCYAYWGVEPLPRDPEPLPDNVVIALTQDTSQHFDPDYRAADRKLWLDWSRYAAHVGKYDYYGLGWLTPRYFPHLAGSDIQFISVNSAAGFYCEVYPNWSVTAPQLYMASRLLWDSSIDPDALLNEYYAALFGPASGEMKKFYSLLEKYWTQPRKGRWFQGLDNVRPELAMLDEASVEEAWQCLMRAKPLAIGPEVERIADIENHFKFTYEIVKGCAQARRLAGWKITGQPDLAKLISEALKALEMVRIAERTHREVWLTDPLYQHAYYGDNDRFRRKFLVWRDDVRAGVQVALLKVNDYCRNRLPADQRETVWRDLRDRLLSDPTAQQFKILDSLEPKLACRKVTSPITVDGDLSDWAGIDQIDFDPDRTGNGKEHKAGDLGGHFRMAWDDDCFYFACEVADSELVQTRSDALIWQQDSVQIAFDPRLDALSDVGYGDDDCEIGFAASPDGPVTWRWQSPKGRANGRVATVKTAVADRGGKTVYEVAVPWSELAFDRVADGACFGFSVVVNDADSDGGRTFLEWAGGIAGSKDPRQFVPVALKS